MSALYLLAGFVFLFMGGHALVSGSVRIANALNVSRAFVGLVLVGIGTSAPELAFGIGSAITGHGDLVAGNVIGSNIVNIGLALGLAFLVRAMVVDPDGAIKQVPAMLVVTAAGLYVVLDHEVTRVEGAVLLLFSVALLVYLFFQENRSTAVESSPAESTVTQQVQTPQAEVVTKLGEVDGVAINTVSEPNSVNNKTWLSFAKPVGMVLFGIAMLVLGAELLIRGAVDVAVLFGVSESVISLTVTAFGTGIPELTATIAAAYRREFELALGNVVGSNIMNFGLVLSSSALVAPLHDIHPGMLSIIALAVFSIALALIFYLNKATRLVGALLACAYLVYTVLTFSALNV